MIPVKMFNAPEVETQLPYETVSVKTAIQRYDWETTMKEDNIINPPTKYSQSHYDFDYLLTEKDISAGKIRVDAYFVSKQWRIGSKDDSGALFHSLKTIARFGDKNPIEREIKALYNQAKAMARIYNVDLGD